MNSSEPGNPLPKRTKAKGGFKSLASRHLPIINWVKKYDRMTAVSDLVAGITLGLTIVPQSIAYAALANLPVQYGLYSAFLGPMVYTLFGTVKEVSIGPTSLMALLVLQTCKGLPIAYVTLLSFLSGCVVMLMGILKLGFLVDLISPSVISGFTSATAVIIIASQLKGLLGLKFVAESVVDNIVMISKMWHEVRLNDCILGAVCCVVLLSLRKVKDIKVSNEKVKKALWFLSISRNAIVVFSCSTFAYCTYDPADIMFKLSGKVQPGLPNIALPPFGFTSGNTTVTFVEMVQELGSAIVMLPIIMVLANSAIAKAFSPGGRVDAGQEMLALGMCNMVGAFGGSIPTCGAFTRSAVSHSSGVRTPAASLYTGMITLLALIFMTEYFFFIPKACLSSVLICAVVFMIDFEILGRLWRESRTELCILLLTFSVSMAFTVELALLGGMVAMLAALLRNVMRPALPIHAVKTPHGEVLRVRPTLSLVYLNIEHVMATILEATCCLHTGIVVVDCSSLTVIDYAGAQGIDGLSKKLKENNQTLLFYNASPESLRYLETLKIDQRTLRLPTAAEAVSTIQLQMTEICEKTPLIIENSNGEAHV